MINNKLINYKEVIDLIYPIGSIYISVNNVNPSTLFGGTWTQLKDKFLIGTGDTYSNGTTGGASSIKYTPAGTNKNGAVQSHILTIDEIPSHNHTLRAKENPSGLGDGYVACAYGYDYKNSSIAINNAGGGKGHTHGFTQPTFTGTQATLNTMPPYLAVYMWKRIV